MPNRSVTRSTVNKEQYAAPEFAKSGFAPHYSRHTSLTLGRLEVAGVHWTMPGDKIYGQNSGDLTYNRLVTPMVSPCDAGQYNFYLPLRAIDKTFEQGMTPTELNAMSANWHTPKVTTRQLVAAIFRQYYEGMEDDFTDFMDYGFTQIINNPNDNFTVADILNDSPATFTLYGTTDGLLTLPIKALTDSTSSLYKMAEKMYLCDVLQDIADNIKNKLGTLDNPISDQMQFRDFLVIYLDALLTAWVGRYSYYAQFRFNYIRPWDIYRLTHQIGINTMLDHWYQYFDNTPLCEYPLRVMYAIWYERFRDIHIEPVSTTLPYWRDFGSTSIFDLSAGGNLCYLLIRPRSWYNDPFTTAQIDNISRHVYAPIYNSSGDGIAYSVNSINNLDTQSNDIPGYPNDTVNSSLLSAFRKPSVYNLGWHDQLTGQDIAVSCPVPSNVNDILSNLDREFFDFYGLDLNTLRQSQMLERYLKRNYFFGDEYQDRMLAHYNSRVSDMRINKPELLSQSLNQSEMSQEISNVSTDETKVGQRTATSTVTFGGDEYGTFCEEFGIVVNLLSVMPHAIYDGLDQHLLLDQQQDFPIPEFASNNEEFGRKSEIASSGLAPDLLGDDENNQFMFGRYPAYHIWRGRVDEVGGMFLDELQDCTFRRFWGLFSKDTTPKLNYWFLHCRPNLGMFANTNRLDSQLYGTINHEFYVERVLPTPVETI